MKHIWIFLFWAGLPLGMACSSVPNAEQPKSVAATSVESLPRHLTVEIHHKGSLKLDGQAISPERLGHELASAWHGGEFAEVLLWADAGTAEAKVRKVMDTLLSVGVSNWRFAWRGEQAGEVPSVAATTTAVEPEIPVEQKPQNFNLKAIGLHIGGRSKDDPSRAPLLKLFEQQFPAFSRCGAELSEPLSAPASFGIDLYVVGAGGVPQLREVRTRLRPEAFHSCMKRVFSSMVFPPSPKGPVVISYSLAFEPVSSDKTP